MKDLIQCDRCAKVEKMGDRSKPKEWTEIWMEYGKEKYLCQECSKLIVGFLFSK
jgi:hypothetical protein